MSRSVCFIGNSHLVSFKLAWDDMQPPNLSADMFAAAMDYLKDLAFSDGKIVPLTNRVRTSFEMTAGESTIDVKKYHAFCIVACGFDPAAAINQFETHAFYGSKIEAPNLVSREAFMAAAVDHLDSVTATRILKLIRRGSDAPVYVFPQPFRSDAILTMPSRRSVDQIWKRVVECGDAERLGHFFAGLYQQYSENHNVIVVAQSDETLFNPILTKRLYNQNAVRLRPGFSQQHRPNDCTHMNKAFGASQLSDFLEHL